MKGITVIAWNRTKFYDCQPVNSYMYYFVREDNTVVWEDEFDIPSKFLRIPSTALFEYGGTHEEALDELEKMGFTHVTERNNLLIGKEFQYV